MLTEPLLQFLTQGIEFGHAGFDQIEFVLQQLGNGIGRVGRLPQRGDAAADLTQEHTPGFSLVAP